MNYRVLNEVELSCRENYERIFRIIPDHGHEIWKNKLRENIRLEIWYEGNNDDYEQYDDEENNNDYEQYNYEEEEKDQVVEIQEEVNVEGAWLTVYNGEDFYWDLNEERFNHLKYIDLELNILEKKKFNPFEIYP
jgi:hypothetical protein